MKAIQDIKFFACAAALALLLCSASTYRSSEAIVGIWQTEEGQQILIQRTSTRFTGKLIYDGKHKVDGPQMLRGLRYENGKWLGKVFCPKRKRCFDLEAGLVNGNKLELQLSWGIISKTIECERI